jgi:triphosphatase
MIKPFKAVPLAYDKTTSVNDAFKYILRAGIAQMSANRHGAIVGRNSEFLHQMRVGMRRTNTAMWLFASFGSDFKDKFLSIELKWLMEETNDARNWDVFLGESLVPFLEERGKNKIGQKLKETAYAIRAEKYIQAREAVNSWRYEKMEMQFDVWLGLEPWMKGGDFGQKRLWNKSVKKEAPALLDEIHEEMFSKGQNADKTLSVEQLHELRLKVKKMRYSAEFFAHLYSKKKAGEFLKRLENLQTVLGEFNDRTIATGFLPDLAEKAGQGVMISKLADEFALDNTARLEELPGSILKKLEKFKKQKAFW